MGSKGSTVTTQSNQSYKPDPRIQQAGYQAIGGAEQAAQAPFQMPVAPTAGFSPLQEQAFNQVQNAQGMALPYFDQAAQYMQGSAAPISGQDVSQYYNPFAQNVFANLQDVFGQQMHQATGNAVQQAGGTGADRIGVAQANLAKQQGLAAGQTAASLYQPALQAAQQQKQMMAGAGFGLGQLGPAAQASYLQGTSALAGAGAQQQALQQQQMNAQYQQQLAQIAYPFQTPQYLAGITGGLAGAMGGTTAGQSQTTYPQPSPLNQALGVGTAALGAYMGMPGLGMGGGGLKGGGYNPVTASYPLMLGGGFRRGGRLPFASGGSTYGDLASQRFANSPVGNPYSSGDSDDSDSDKDNYAIGGEVATPLPGSAPLPLDTTSVVPKIPFGGGQANHPTLDLKHQPLQQAPSIAGDIASGLKTATKLMSARGGAVNPFDYGQPMQDGGDPDLQGIDAPMGDTYNPLAMPQMVTKPYSRTGDRSVSETLFGGSPPQNQTPVVAEAPLTHTNASRPDVLTDMGPSNPLSMREGIPLPRGNPTKPLGARATMANEASRAGASENAIRGLNMAVNDESKFNPFSREADQPRFGGEAHYAHGLFQEGGEEWNNYRAWLDKNHPDANWQDPALQTRFLAENLKQNYPEVWRGMSNAKTPGEAAAIFTEGYLKPAQGPRDSRVAKYMSGQGDEGDSLAGDTTEISGRTRTANPSNPFVTGNSDMTLGSVMQNPNRPYPDSTQRDWGQKLTRSPWMALVEGGAKMAQTVGPVGSAIGAGIGAGSKTLQGQRQELQNEEQVNQKADHLFQQAKQHLDKYQRMTPYEDKISQWREATNERKTTTSHQRDAQWYVDNGIAPDLKAAVEMLKTGVNTAAGYARMVEAAKKTILQANPGMDEGEAETKARERVRERGALTKPDASPAIGDKRVFKDRAGNDVTGVWDGTEWKPETT